VLTSVLMTERLVCHIAWEKVKTTFHDGVPFACRREMEVSRLCDETVERWGLVGMMMEAMNPWLVCHGNQCHPCPIWTSHTSAATPNLILCCNGERKSRVEWEPTKWRLKRQLLISLIFFLSFRPGSFSKSSIFCHSSAHFSFFEYRQ